VPERMYCLSWKRACAHARTTRRVLGRAAPVFAASCAAHEGGRLHTRRACHDGANNDGGWRALGRTNLEGPEGKQVDGGDGASDEEEAVLAHARNDGARTHEANDGQHACSEAQSGECTARHKRRGGDATPSVGSEAGADAASARAATDAAAVPFSGAHRRR
jgi:hypothetical protein